MLKNKVLMITGGTGSFGNTVLNRFLSTDIREIVIFSRDEKKQEDMRIALNNPKVRFQIGDVRDYGSVSRAMTGVDYVFHAAALKQVPSCEFFPMEAVMTNVIGTENVLNAAIERNVGRVVVLSTDKAVYPINAMGISKAMAEKLLIAKSRTVSEGGSVLCATRYGNVMASRGSVIPLFVEKLKAGMPLTVTDPSMTRFLMSLEDSVDLVLHAFEHGKQGDIFVQKAPSCSIQISPRRYSKFSVSEHRSRLLAPVMARSSTSLWCLVRKWRKLRTWGATTESPQITGISTTTSSSLKGKSRQTQLMTTHRIRPND